MKKSLTERERAAQARQVRAPGAASSRSLTKQGLAKRERAAQAQPERAPGAAGSRSRLNKGLAKRDRVTNPRQVRALYRAPVTRGRRGLRVFFQPNGGGGSRVVVCPGRGFASAPARNRQRRLVREAYRLLKHRVTPGYDLLLQVRPRQPELGFRAAGGVLARLLSDAGLLRSG